MKDPHQTQASHKPTPLQGVFLLLCGALALYLFLWHLGSFSISTASDEVVYVRVSQSVYHRQSLFPLRHGTVPMFEKPPLKFWLAGAVLALFGESNLTFRLLDGLSGLGCTVLVVLLARRLFGMGWLAIAAGLLYLAPAELVISHHSFRRAVLDGQLSVLTLLCAWWTVAAVERAREGRSPLGPVVAASMCCALATLTKSVAGLVPLLCSGLIVLSSVPWRRWLPLILGYSAAPLAFAGYVVVLWLYGHHALKTFLGIEIVDRVVGGFTGHNTGDPFYYLWYLFVRGAAASAILLAVGSAGALAGVRDHRLRFLLVWSYVPVLLFSGASSKVPWYLNPYLPFLILTALYGSAALLARLPGADLRRAGALALVVCTAIPCARAISWNVRTVARDTKRIDLDRLADELRAEAAAGKVYLFNDAISGRANPVRGKFNVEGIYRQMLNPVAAPRGGFGAATPREGAVLFVRDAELPLIPPGWSPVVTLPPFSIRKEPVTVVRYPPKG